jgi:hypothetical protein
LPQNIYSSSSKKEDYELQEKCGKQSKEYFEKEYGQGIRVYDGGQSETITFQNHYNEKLNKCFIILTTKGFIKNEVKSYYKKSLFDINENNEYGFFYMTTTSFICNLFGKKCNSEQEWDSLVKPYMEE